MLFSAEFDFICLASHHVTRASHMTLRESGVLSFIIRQNNLNNTNRDVHLVYNDKIVYVMQNK